MRSSRAMFDRALMRGDAFEANSIPELASLLQIPAEALVATVDAYKTRPSKQGTTPSVAGPPSSCTASPDALLRRQVTMCVNGTLGGIAITRGPKCSISTRPRHPRLYAAGEVTGGVHGANYMGGNALSEVFTFGRIAGENAVQEPFA